MLPTTVREANSTINLDRGWVCYLLHVRLPFRTHIRQQSVPVLVVAVHQLLMLASAPSETSTFSLELSTLWHL